MGTWRARFGFLWARAGDASLAWEIFSRLLLLKGAIALVGVAVTVGIGFLEHQPLSVLLTIGIVTFAAVMWIAGQVIAMLPSGDGVTMRVGRLGHRRRGYTPPDDLPFDRPAVSVTPNRKGYLLLEMEKQTIVANHARHPMTSECRIGLRSSAPMDLKHCRVRAASIKGDHGNAAKLDYSLDSADDFTIPAGGFVSLKFITRDLADIVGRPPHVLHFDGDRGIDLAENRTFLLRLVVESEYEFPTTATLLIRTGREAHLEVEIRDQFI